MHAYKCALIILEDGPGFMDACKEYYLAYQVALEKASVDKADNLGHAFKASIHKNML